MVSAVRIRAVLDASALFGVTNRRNLTNAARDGAYQGFWSAYVIEELARALTEQYWRRTPWSHAEHRTFSDLAKRMMTLMVPVITMTAAHPFIAQWPGSDPGDAHLVGAGLAASAQYIVSENTRDFPPANGDGHRYWAGIRYVSVETFFALLNGDEWDDWNDDES